MTDSMITKLVLNIKATGDYNTMDFVEVFNQLLPRVEVEAKRYLQKTEYKNFSIDPSDLVSRAMNEGLLRRIELFDGRGTFTGYFFANVSYDFNTVVRDCLRIKRQVNSIPAVSLDKQTDTNGSTVGDQLPSTPSKEDFSDEMADLINLFGEKYGEEAKEVILAYAYHDKKEANKRILEIFNTEKPTDSTRKKALRIRKKFQNFIG